MSIARLKSLRTTATASPWEAGATLPVNADLIAEYARDGDAGLSVELTNDLAELIALYDAVKAYQVRMNQRRAPLAAQRRAIDAAVRALET
jgi:hypothetical protein